MARLAARWRRSNLVILVALKKGNHPSETYVRRERRKTLYRRETDSLKVPHEEAEIKREAVVFNFFAEAEPQENISVARGTPVQ